MRINSHAKTYFHKPVDPFFGNDGISSCNCFFGEASSRVRKYSSKTDRVSYIYNEKSRYIYAKKNVDGLRR